MSGLIFLELLFPRVFVTKTRHFFYETAGSHMQVVIRLLQCLHLDEQAFGEVGGGVVLGFDMTLLAGGGVGE